MQTNSKIPPLKDLTLEKLSQILPSDLTDDLYRVALKKHFKMTYKEYLVNNDPKSSVTKFLKDRMILADHHCLKNFSTLLFQTAYECYAYYLDFCENSGLNAVDLETFSKEMADRGFQKSCMDLRTDKHMKDGFVGVHCLHMDRDEWFKADD